MISSKTLSWALLFCSVLLLPGCNQELLVDCLPVAGFKPQISNTEPQKPPAVDVYLDASLSMKGYVVNTKDTRHEEYVYPQLLEHSVRFFNEVETYSLYKFGTKILPVPGEMMLEATRQTKCFGSACKGFYDTDPSGNLCTKANQDTFPECVNQDSDLVKVFNQASQSDALSVIVSDFFLSTQQAKGFLGMMTPALQQIFKDGKTITLIGVASRFVGTVYDLSLNSKPHPLDGTRPFYIILIGKKPHVDWLERRLTAQLDRMDGAIFDSVQMGEGNEAPMTLIEADPAKFTNQGTTITDLLLSDNYSWIPQYYETNIAPNINILFTPSKGSVLFPDMLSTEVRTRVWAFRNGGPSCPDSWASLSDTVTIVNKSDSAIPIDVESLVGPLQLDTTYFVDIAVKPKEWSVSFSQPDWIEVWNFDSIKARTVTQQNHDVFPTQNLRTFCETVARAALDNKTSNTAFRVQFAIRRTGS